MQELACSDSMRRYFSELFRENERCYAVATEARSRGLDPSLKVEIPPAEDLADRVEKQLSDWHVDGVAERIREISRRIESREEVSLLIAKELVLEAIGDQEGRELAIERAVRVGLSVLTEGILVAPIVGIAGVKINQNTDGTEYLSLFFNGPIRSAGGTAQAMSVLIADVVRREFGIGAYQPTRGEVERLKEEIPLYKQCQHLQYTPSNEEIDLIYSHCPVCVDGEKTEDKEISGFRDLPRIKTNSVRGGVCLVIAEGLCLKAPKIEKHVKKLGLEGWEFITEYLRLKKGDSKDDKGPKVVPDYKYLKDIVAGRPVIGHPSRPGGLRLRYGRGRTTGLAAIALNPATMYALDNFLAIGTQIKLERPGKAGAVTPCDRLEGPILLLENGNLVQTNTVEEFLPCKGKVREIVDVGQILLPFGEFVENNHILVPGDYDLEWHRAELRAVCGDELPDGWEDPGDFQAAWLMSQKHNVPLHPKYNLFWYDLPLTELRALRAFVLANGRLEGGHLIIPADVATKRTLELLGALHTVTEGEVVLERYSLPLLAGLGLLHDGQIIDSVQMEDLPVMDVVSKCTGVRVNPRSVTRIGSRMARPEKAKDRSMKAPSHTIFPIGMAGGPQRLMEKAAEKGTISVKMGVRKCEQCGNKPYLYYNCSCGGHTIPIGEAQEISLDVKDMLEQARISLGEKSLLTKLKGEKELKSKDLNPEPLEKGILRRKHEIYVNKDGTIRFDLTDVPLTHFRPREIGLSVERARELGYEFDVHDQPLTDPEQLCELKVQDIVPSISCGDFMVRVSNFVDDLLDKFYGLPRYYNAKSKEDLIGQLTMGLAPHTSGGILCRMIGFTRASVCFGHPFFHAAKRRNADGDEDSVVLLLDGLLNFSRSYLPDSRGGLMDAPLVLGIRLDPNEVDKEAQNIDVLWEYPLEFYRASVEMKHPKEVQGRMDLVSERIKSLLQYEGFGITHDTNDIAEGPPESAYKTLETMMDKMTAQVELAKRIRAVDEGDVVSRVITKHFLPDLIGNLNSFSGQKFRCTKCGESYRRVPLSGHCYCGHKLNLTVYEASVKKYLEVTSRIGRDFAVSDYTQQRIRLIEESIISIFGKEESAATLDSFDEGGEEGPEEIWPRSDPDAPEEDQELTEETAAPVKKTICLDDF
ncbi:MAG: DNA polymerase II large subunit [Methanomassiliicoccales archaeon]|nr:DNA polymerase II large subunit [Methanomassiliicoccales archaeon]